MAPQPGFRCTHYDHLRSFPCRRLPSRAGAGQRPNLQTASGTKANTDPVVSPDWLQRRLQDVLVLDCRGHVEKAPAGRPGQRQRQYAPDYNEYLSAHIPGATFVDWTRDGVVDAGGAAAEAGAGAGVLPRLQADPALFAADLEQRGLSSSQTVVVYDSGDGLVAARLWWALVCHGHEAVKILEGGWRRWVADERATELHEPCPLCVYGTFEPERTAFQHFIPAGQLLQALDGAASSSSGQPAQQQCVVLDVSEAEDAEETGRDEFCRSIPGVISLPRSQLVDPATGWLQPLDARMKRLEAAGVDCSGSMPRQRIVLLDSDGGLAACTVALTLSQLGLDDWAVYNGTAAG